MTNASTLDAMSPQLRKLAERARREPDGWFHALAHLLDVPALARAYYRFRAGAAVGVDGVTKDSYGQHLPGNLRGLHERLRAQRWRLQPILRVHIPKSFVRRRGRFMAIGYRGQEPVVYHDLF